MDTKQKFAELEKLIGNTPMLKINYLYQGQPRCVYAKAEHYDRQFERSGGLAYLKKSI
jgi:cysteine synthase A